MPPRLPDLHLASSALPRVTPSAWPLGACAASLRHAALRDMCPGRNQAAKPGLACSGTRGRSADGARLRGWTAGRLDVCWPVPVAPPRAVSASGGRVQSSALSAQPTSPQNSSATTDPLSVYTISRRADRCSPRSRRCHIPACIRVCILTHFGLRTALVPLDRPQPRVRKPISRSWDLRPAISVSRLPRKRLSPSGATPRYGTVPSPEVPMRDPSR